MQEIEYNDELYEFPDEATDEQIEEFFQPEPEKHRLEAGVYQDDNNALFRVTEEGDIHGLTEGQA